ncbi:MAG: hypothetical protein ACHQ9S_10675 [Candidatus Binatia bacterium]
MLVARRSNCYRYRGPDYFGAALSSTTIASSLFEPLRIEMVDEQAHPDGLQSTTTTGKTRSRWRA